MANRSYNKQPVHDGAVHAAKLIYQEHGKFAWINPDGEKNKSWNGYYIDVIAVDDPQATSAYVTEIETEDSVNDAEASNQWKNYDEAYTQRWYLAVPTTSKADAEWLLQKHRIVHCQVITWAVDQYSRYTFWGLPGL